MPSADTGHDAAAPALQVPDRMLARDTECDIVTHHIRNPGQQHLHIAGPRGSGKTLLTMVAHAQAEPPATVCYVPCRRYDTQYQVLTRLTARLTGKSVADGHRSAHLQRTVSAALADTPAVLVLDDIEFLLRHDGDDLLYFLSRLDDSTALTIVSIATPAVDLASALDARTYSSYQPRHLSIVPYTEEQAAQILARHANAVVPQPVTAAAVWRIARQTTNIHVGLHWLTRAAEVHDAHAVITATTLQVLRWDAFHRYWLATLTAFTRHHAIALKAIEQVTTETNPAYTGRVYDRYATLCRCRGSRPLTSRRISDFLDHLELLGLIQVEHHRGGTVGKTRAIRLTPLEEL
jgi:Cdc6-like AAA superfamily ATPase